jgi:hypothetical protein
MDNINELLYYRKNSMQPSQATQREINRWRGPHRPGRQETARRITEYHRMKAHEERQKEDEVWSWIGARSVLFDQNYLQCTCLGCDANGDYSDIIFSYDLDEFIEFTSDCTLTACAPNHLRIKPLDIHIRLGAGRIRNGAIEWIPFGQSKSNHLYCEGGLIFQLSNSVIIQCPRYHAKYVEMFLMRKKISYRCDEQSYLDLINPKETTDSINRVTCSPQSDELPISPHLDLSVVGHRATLYSRDCYDWRCEYETYSDFMESKYDTDSDLMTPEPMPELELDTPKFESDHQWFSSLDVDATISIPQLLHVPYRSDTHENNLIDEVALPLPLEEDQRNQVTIHLPPPSPVTIYWDPQTDLQSEMSHENLRLTPEPIPIESDDQSEIQEEYEIEPSTESQETVVDSWVHLE